MARALAMPRAGEPISLVVTSSGRSRYRTVLDYAPPGHSRKQRRATFDTLTEARAHVSAVRADRGRGALPAGLNTFSQIADEWWLDRQRRGRRAITLRGYSDSLAHARRAFGEKPVDRVSRGDVETLAETMQKEGLAPRTVSLCLGLVRSVFVRALTEGHVVRNPAVGVQPHTGEPAKRVPLTLIEGRKVAEAAEQDRLAAAWLLTLVGLRRSEVLGLVWGDVDVVFGKLHVRRSRVAVGASDTVSPTKTKAGTRDLPLPADLLGALRAWRTSVASDLGVQVLGEDMHVFVDGFGVPIRPEWYSDEWLRLCHRAGIRRRVKLHEARHSSVMAMRAAGLPDRMIAAWHGHSERVMVDTYDHPDLDQEGLASVGQSLEALRKAAG